MTLDLGKRWTKVQDGLPDPSCEVIVYCKALPNTAYIEGEPYMAIDSIVHWKDGSIPSFRTERFKHGSVSHWHSLPEAPDGSV